MAAITGKQPGGRTERLLRLKQVLEIIPVGKTTWWNGVKSKRFPEPIKLGPRTTCWRESEIMELMSGIEQG